MKRFNHLQQCLVLFGLCLLGAVIGELSPVSVPGSVVGMVPGARPDSTAE